MEHITLFYRAKIALNFLNRAGTRQLISNTALIVCHTIIIITTTIISIRLTYSEAYTPSQLIK